MSNTISSVNKLINRLTLQFQCSVNRTSSVDGKVLIFQPLQEGHKTDEAFVDRCITELNTGFEKFNIAAWSELLVINSEEDSGVINKIKVVIFD